MANPSKQKGTRAETRVVRYLESCGFTARRQALAGSDDHGDIEAYAPGFEDCKMIIEIKTGKQTANPSRSQIIEWCRQAKVEAENEGTEDAVLIVVRYNRRLEDADVWIPYDRSRVHWYLGDWVNHFA